MAAEHVLIRAASAVATGVVGAAAYDGLRRLPFRKAAVTATTWGIQGSNKAEETAERVRLAAADIYAEAKDRLGEEVTPPASGGHDHSH